MRSMLSLLSPALETYVLEHTTRESPLLERLRAETQAKLAYPQMQVGPIEGQFLRCLVAMSRARRILEIGTYSGYSALCMASALPDDGQLITCDIDPVATAMARRYFDESGYGHKIEIRYAPAMDTLTQLRRIGHSFDLVFIDADKEAYADYWEQIVPLLPSGGLVVADNTLWNGRVLAPSHPSDHGIVRFNARVANDQRIEHVLLAIRDGIMLARKH